MASQSYNVLNFGAVGDGVAADAVAFQNTFNAALAGASQNPQQTSQVLIPPGQYMLGAQIVLLVGATGSAQQYNLEILGDGPSTILLHGGSGALFNFQNQASQVTVSSLTIQTVTTQTTGGNAAFYFPYGNTKSEFTNISLEPGTHQAASFYFCESGATNDTIQFTDVEINGVDFIGMQFGSGSSIFYSGGRIIGSGVTGASVGINFTGGNGGVYIDNVDIIRHATGIQTSQSSGTTNREFFFSNLTLDSCGIGLAVSDSSYISWTGVWAASSNICINFNPASNAAILNLSGGTIFNAGTLGGKFKYGFSYNGLGRVQMTGLVIRNNAGGGFVMNQPAQVPIMITGCQFFGNSGLGNIKALSGLNQSGNVLE